MVYLVSLTFWNNATLQLFTMYIAFYHKMSNWLLRHYGTFTSLGGELLQQSKTYSIVELQ